MALLVSVHPGPTNDKFAFRQRLPRALPQTLSGSNVGATLEADESPVREAAEHSVWYVHAVPQETVGAATGTNISRPPYMKIAPCMMSSP